MQGFFMKNYMSIGDLHRLKNGLPYDEHDAFYEYLLISPSYLLAHQLATGTQLNKNQTTGIPDWEIVEKTYALCGNVYERTFLQWWDCTGRALFYTQQSDGSYVEDGPLKLQKNKINMLTLMKGYVLVNFKHSGVEFEEKIPNWKLGVDANIRSKWVKELKGQKKLTHENLEARTELGVLVSRKIKEAFNIAENAARGSFPNSTKIETGLDFDYRTIRKHGEVLSVLTMKEEDERIRAGRQRYRLSIIKKFLRKKNKAEKEKQLNKSA
jgi:hypothetical protein